MILINLKVDTYQECKDNQQWYLTYALSSDQYQRQLSVQDVFILEFLFLFMSQITLRQILKASNQFDNFGNQLQNCINTIKFSFM